MYRRANLAKNKTHELQKALEMNQPLATAYLLKEELALAWKQETWEARADSCCARGEKAMASGIDPLISMAPSPPDPAERLLSYAVTKMTSGRRQGIHRKIKTLLRQVYEFRDDDFLRLKLYALHESTHKLVG